MSRQFDDMFVNGDLTDADHIKQLIHPLEDLEKGMALFRNAVSSGATYGVGFQAADTASPDGYFMTAPLTAGQMVVFKADAASSPNAQLEVTFEGGGSASHPLHVGNDPVGAGDIKQNQIVVAIYNDTNPPRFDVVGLGGASGGGGGVSVLDDLSDVSIGGSPTSGEIIQNDGSGQFVNRDLASAGISEVGHTHTAADVSGVQPQDPALDEISALSMGKGDLFVHDGGAITKIGPGTDGQVLQADSATSTGLTWASVSGGGGGGASELNDLDDVAVSGVADGELLQFDAGANDFVNRSPDAAGLVGQSRLVNTAAPMQGGGALSADLTLSMPAASASQDGYLSSSDFADFDAKQDLSEKAQPNGYASLGADGKVPASQLPTGSGGTVSIGVGEVGFGDASGDITSDVDFTFKSNRLGVGLPSATRKLEVRDTAGPQQRLSYDASKRWDFHCDAGGDLAITTSDVNSNMAIGSQASNSSGRSNIAIGPQAKNIAGDHAVAIGRSADTQTWGIAVGFNAHASAGSVALGYSSLTTSSYAHAIGRNSEANNHGVAMGFDATAAGVSSVSLGRQSLASGALSVVVGPYASATGLSAMALGDDAQANARHSLGALGAIANHEYSLAFGRDAETSGSHQAVIGGTTGYISDLYVGNGPSVASPVDAAINGSGALGADIAGAKMTLAGGQSTGSASGGAVSIATSPSGAAGSSSNALVERFVIDGEGRMGFFGAAPAAQSTGWNISNPSVNKSLDVSSPTLASVAEMLGTLVDDLKNLGILGA